MAIKKNLLHVVAYRLYDAKSIPVRGDQWMISPFNINQLPLPNCD